MTTGDSTAGGDLPAMRAGDADREATVVRLREACAEGRLGLEEFTVRLDTAYRATTRGELEELTRDLPRGIERAPAGRERRWFLGIFGGGTTKGRWRVAPRITVVDVFGGTDLDLRDAIVTAPEVTITAIAVFGGCDIIVPEGADVGMTGGAIFGGNDLKMDSAPVQGGPRIRVRALSLFGGIDVEERPRRERRLRETT